MLCKKCIWSTKLNIKTLAAESCIVFLNNRTSDWFNSKDETERDQLIKEASKQVKSLKLKFRNKSTRNRRQQENCNT
jgi:hypothetical protein